MTHGQSAFLVALGVLFMWLCWMDYGWFYFLIAIPRRSLLGFRRKATRQEEEWDRLMTRFVFFVLALAFSIWHLGSMLGIWNQPPDPQGS